MAPCHHLLKLERSKLVERLIVAIERWLVGDDVMMMMCERRIMKDDERASSADDEVPMITCLPI